MADEVHPVPVVVLPADVPEAPPAVVPAVPAGEKNPANAAVAAPQEVICFFAHKFASARFTRVISFP